MANDSSITRINPKIVSLIIILIPLFCVSKVYAQSIYQGPASGSISGGAPVSTGSFSDKDPELPVPNIVIPNRTARLIDDKFIRVLPSAPAGSNVIIDRGATFNSNNNPTAPGLIFDFIGIGETGLIPPDPHIAAGPNHLVATVNSDFAIFDKNGNKLHQISAANWFSNVLSDAFPGDPQVVYDHHSGRWIMVWVEFGGGPISLLLSVSDDSDPNGTWCNWRIPGDQNGSTTTGFLNDFPKLGVDKDAIYVTANMFSSTFEYVQLRVIPKAQLLDNQCGPVSWTDFWDLRFPSNPAFRVSTVVPAVAFDTTDTMYLINASRFTPGTFVTLWTFNNSLIIPLTAVDIPVTQYFSPPDASQLGGGLLIQVGGRRFRNAVVRDGHIWTAHSIAGGADNAYAFARYLRIDTQASSVVEDIAFGADGFWYYYPAITVDRNHNMTMCFTRSGFTEYAGAWYTGRFDNDPPGLSSSKLLKEGEDNYVNAPSGFNRWGDYMGIALDPTDDVIWSFVEYAASPVNTWGTWVGATTHKYIASGFVRDATTQNPIEFARLEVVETGQVIETDSTGSYSFGSPTPDVTINASAFAYQDTTVIITLTLYNPDTLDILLSPETESTIAGQVKDSSTGEGIFAELEFFADGNPNPGPYATTTTDSNGFYSLQTIIGTYDIVVSPEVPYPVTTITDVIVDPTPFMLDIEILPADVFLVNDDIFPDNEIYFQETLDTLGLSYFTWRINENGVPDTTTFRLFPSPETVIWYTGNADTAVLSDAEQQNLAWLLNNGGRLLLTGQNIAETSSGGVLLSNYLGATFNTNIGPPIISGVAGDPIGDGLILSTVGGAGNQDSKDALLITGNADSSFYYGTTSSSGVAGVRTEDSQVGWKSVFLGFGLEGINNSDGLRDSLTHRILNWFDIVTGIEDRSITSAGLIDHFELKQNYPNPFNPQTTIQFSVAERTNVRIQIFNSLGQEVKTVLDEEFPPGVYDVIWEGRDETGRSVSSGIYFYKMSTGIGFEDVRKLLLLR